MCKNTFSFIILSLQFMRAEEWISCSIMWQDSGTWELAIPYPPLVPRTKSGLMKHLLRPHLLGRNCQILQDPRRPLPLSVGISHASSAALWGGGGCFHLGCQVKTQWLVRSDNAYLHITLVIARRKGFCFLWGLRWRKNLLILGNLPD